MNSSDNNRFNSRNWSRGTDSNDRFLNTNRVFQAPRPFPYRPEFPTGFPFSRQVIVLPGEIAHAVHPRLRQFIQDFPPMITTNQWGMQLPPQQDESNLTQEEQNKVLKKLKKVIYNPPPKRKWCLYYRDSGSGNSKEEENDEDVKGCVICIEDFVPNNEVLMTPCNHMFHEDCIIPWVKSHGRCPICRFALSDPRRENNLSLNNNNNNNNSNVAADDLDVAGDLISLLRAMELERMTYPH